MALSIWLQRAEQMNSLWGNIFNSAQKDNKIRNILTHIPVFEDLNDRDLSAIERILHRREYRSDETIFLQGDPGIGMYIIESGKVSIVGGTTRNLFAELQDGEFFGELALFDDSPRTATAVAKTPSNILCFLQPDLFDLIERNPRLGVKILLRLSRTIGERLRKCNEQVNAQS